jgi:hypothetical protein
MSSAIWRWTMRVGVLVALALTFAAYRQSDLMLNWITMVLC